MFVKNKIKKILLATTGLSILPLSITSLVNLKNSEISTYSNFAETGFNLIPPAYSESQRSIIEKTFQKSNISNDLIGIEQDRPVVPDTSLKVSNRSKTHVYNNYFGLNFYELASKRGKDSIVITNFIKEDVISIFDLPKGTIANGVINAQLIENYLWLIIQGKFDGTSVNSYALQVYELTDMETGKPNFRSLNNNPIPINYQPSNLPGVLRKDIVLTPVYKIIDKKMVLDPLQMYIWEQNTLINDFSNEQTGLRRFYIDYIDSSQPLSSKVVQASNTEIGDFTEKPNAKAMALFALTSINDPKLEPNNFALYHSIDSTGTGIYLSSFNKDNNKSSQFLINDTIDIEASNDIINQLSYPKADFSNDGIELFWIFPKGFILNSPPTAIFSNSLVEEGNFFAVKQDYNPINLNSGIEFKLISYQNYGSFLNSGAYIPVRFKSNSTIEIPGAPGISALINWKDTSNAAYWNSDNFLKITPYELTDPIAYTVNINDGGSLYFDLDSIKGQYAQANMFIKNVNLETNTIQYAIYQDLASTLKGQLLQQSRSLSNLNLNYNTKSSNFIHHDIKDEIWKVPNPEIPTELDSLITEIQKKIFDYTSELKGIGNAAPTFSSINIDRDSIKYYKNNETQKLEKIDLKFKYENGTFVDGNLVEYAESNFQDATLQKQPKDYYPIKINFNEKIDLSKKGIDLVDKIKSVLGESGEMPKNWYLESKYQGIVGSKQSDIIQINDLYLPYLRNISLINDEFKGVINAKLTFKPDFPGAVNHDIHFSIKGFYAIEYIIAIVVPVVLIIIITSVSLLIFFQNRKRKKDITKAFTVGMKYNQKISKNPPVLKIDQLEKNDSEKTPKK